MRIVHSIYPVTFQTSGIKNHAQNNPERGGSDTMGLNNHWCNTTLPKQASRAHLLNRRPNVYPFAVFFMRIVTDNKVVDAAISNGVIDNLGVYDEVLQADAFPAGDAQRVPCRMVAPRE